MPSKRLGGVIRDLRTSKNIGLRTLAKTVGISATYLSQIERGEVPRPAYDKIEALAKALGEDPMAFLEMGSDTKGFKNLVDQIPPDLKPVFLRTLRKFSSKDIKDIQRLFTEMAGKNELSRGGEGAVNNESEISGEEQNRK